MISQSETVSTSHIIFITPISTSTHLCCACHQPLQSLQLCWGKKTPFSWAKHAYFVPFLITSQHWTWRRMSSLISCTPATHSGIGMCFHQPKYGGICNQTLKTSPNFSFHTCKTCPCSHALNNINLVDLIFPYTNMFIVYTCVRSSHCLVWSVKPRVQVQVVVTWTTIGILWWK